MMGKTLYVLLIIIAGRVHAYEPSEEREQALLNMLKHDCGACHGLTLKGGLGPSLLPEALAGKNDALLVQTIQNGKPGTAMPPWKRFITDQEAIWLVTDVLKQK